MSVSAAERPSSNTSAISDPASNAPTNRSSTDIQSPMSGQGLVGSELVPSLDGVGDENGTHRVYVVRLERKVLGKKKFTDANPNRSASGLCLYVGLTGLPPRERFENHKKDYKASRWVRDYGIDLMPRFYEPLNKMTYDRAEEVEDILASFLRENGHAVWYN